MNPALWCRVYNKYFVEFYREYFDLETNEERIFMDKWSQIVVSNIIKSFIPSVNMVYYYGDNITALGWDFRIQHDDNDDPALCRSVYNKYFVEKYFLIMETKFTQIKGEEHNFCLDFCL